MSFLLNYDLNLDTVGITDLRAQFMVVDTGVLVNSGAEIDTGFYEVGSGGYYYEGSHDDSFFGLIKFYREADPSTILGIRAIGPREAENLDAKISTGVTLSAPVLLAVADAINARSGSHVEDTAEAGSIAELLMAILNSQTVGEDWIIKKSDGTTFNTRVLELDDTAKPVTGVSNA